MENSDIFHIVESYTFVAYIYLLSGMLQYGRVQQRRPLLPPDSKDELCRGGAVSTDCFKSGDARVNEHPGLVAAHIVWLRQHNR